MRKPIVFNCTPYGTSGARILDVYKGSGVVYRTYPMEWGHFLFGLVHLSRFAASWLPRELPWRVHDRYHA